MGLPIVEAANGIGWPVTEAANGYGLPVTVAANGYGRPVVYVASGGYPVVTEGGAGGIGLPALSMNFLQGFGQSGGSISPVALMLTTVRATPPLAYAESVAGVWTSFPPSIPRITDKGLLIEEARTNSIRNNSMTGAVAGTPGTVPTNWSMSMAATGLSSSVIGTGTENGVDYIDLRIFGTATAGGVVSIWTEATNGIAASPTQAWTQSYFLKLAAGSVANITSVNLNTYELDGAQAFLRNDAGVAALTSTLTRFSRTWTTGASTAFLRPGAYLVVTAAGATDITLRIGWPQLELGAFVTSPIRTTTVAVTRAADVVTVASFTPNATTGTLFSEVIAPTVQGIQTSVEIDDGTANERYTIRSSSGTMAGLVIDGGVGQATGLTAVFTANTVTKSAMAYAANDIAFSQNGAAVLTDASATLPTVTTFVLGSRGAGGDWLCGYIRRVSYWNTRLTNAQLQAITSSSVSSALVNEMSGLGVPYPLADYMTRTFVPSVP